jgi:hypothetical protein
MVFGIKIIKILCKQKHMVRGGPEVAITLLQELRILMNIKI